MRRLAFITVIALVAVASAAAVGPSPGTAPELLTASARYTATPTPDGWDTVVRSGDVRRRLVGQWGFPRVTFAGAVDGLSRDRRTLVLAELSQGMPASPSRFLVLDPSSLQVKRRISLPGSFAFDALSPDARRLYLVQYVSVVGDIRYRVRAYDLRTGQLVRRVIADKRSGWTAMSGMPMSRATSADGTWVYTLYANGPKPFVHALNARAAYAVCVDLPLGSTDLARARLQLNGDRLSVVKDGRTIGTVDTASLQVVGE
jgi:hypothetical protein